ncbi:MAG: hypothetical protein RL622_47 [Actinomycetota bacterium]
MGLDFQVVKSLAEARRNTFKSPKPDPSRLLAFDLLTEVNRNEGYSNLLLPQALNASKLEERDRALVTELLYGTIRMQGKHDWVLSQISDRPWNEVDPGIVDICRLGVHQIHEMRIPDHAAVASTVEVARKRVGESKASFVNALLRSVTRKSIEEWFAPLLAISDPVERLSIHYSHPEWIVSAYFDLLKNWQEVEAALKINNEAALPTLVAWPGFSTQQDLIDTFTANEYSAPRAELVKQVVHGDRVLVSDGRQINSFGEKFDAILIDAPCTGLGALRRRPEVRWRRTLQDLRALTQLQRELIDSAIEALNSGGVLGYATCSPHLAETSIQISDIKRKHTELKQIDVKPFLPKKLEGANRDGAMSLWTHKHGTDAMYLALFQKVQG